MLKKEDFDHVDSFAGWWLVVVVATNQAIHGFSAILGINFVDNISAIRYAQYKPSLSAGIFYSLIVIFCLSGITYKAYKRAKARPDYEKITIRNSLKTYAIFLTKYVIYSFIFIIGLHTAYSILRFIF